MTLTVKLEDGTELGPFTLNYGVAPVSSTAASRSGQLEDRRTPKLSIPGFCFPNS